MTTVARDIAFTVVVPTHNRPEVTVRAVRSVLAQTHERLRVVVVDDGSTDDTAAQVARLDDDRLSVVRQPNTGAPGARNRGAAEAGPGYLTFLDSDDVVEHDWLEVLAEHAARTGCPPVLTCGFTALQAGRGVAARLPGPVRCWPGLRGSFGHAGTFALDPALFRRVGGYAEGLPAGQHTELAHRFLRHVTAPEVCVVDRALLTYHVGAEGNIRGDDAAVAAGAAYVLREHADLVARDRRHRADLRAVAGVRSIRAGRAGEGRGHLVRSLLDEPHRPRRWAMAAVGLVPPLAARRWPASRPRTPETA